jgi:hypothetical protein
MSLKGAALLAFIGTALITAFLTWRFVFNIVNVLRGAEPPVVLFSSFIYAFGCFTLALFLFIIAFLTISAVSSTLRALS